MPTVAVFDSGIGGLSIVRNLLPWRNRIRVIYLMDNRNLPYGEKSDLWIQDRCRIIAKALSQRYRPDILLVACNTASTIALEEMRQSVVIPVVGVVPAIKVAASVSSTGKIGLLATKATVTRTYIDDLVRKFATHCEVVRFPCQEMVGWAEQAFRGRPFDRAALADRLSEFFRLGELPTGARMDAVVLGCTHFSFLIEDLQNLAPWPVQWIDSAEAVAGRVRSLLGDLLALDDDAPQSSPPWWGFATDPVLDDGLMAGFVRLGFDNLSPLDPG